MKNKYEKFDDFAIIQCISRKNEIFEVLVDLDDLEVLISSPYSLFCHWTKNSNAYYATITQYVGIKNGKARYKSIPLHNLIMKSKKGDIIDHINNKTLDNRKSNLRKTSKTNNQRNRKGKNSNNTSGYRNVTKIGKWWRIQLQIEGKNTLLPEKFDDVHEAGKFAKDMRKKYYGEFAGV